MKTSIRCFLFGHKWNFITKVYRDKVRASDPNEPLVYDTHFHPIPHCHYCGQPNPNFDWAVANASIKS